MCSTTPTSKDLLWKLLRQRELNFRTLVIDIHVSMCWYTYFFLQDKSHRAKVAFRSQHWMVAIRTKWGFFLRRRKFFREDLPLFYNILNIKIHSKSFKRKQQCNTFFQNTRWGSFSKHFKVCIDDLLFENAANLNLSKLFAENKCKWYRLTSVQNFAT